MNWAISDREIATPVGGTSMAAMASLLAGRDWQPKTSDVHRGRYTAFSNYLQGQMETHRAAAHERSKLCSTSFPGIHGAPSWTSENQVDGDDLAKFLDALNQPHPVEA